MIGAIAGDICGTAYQGSNCPKQFFLPFNAYCALSCNGKSVAVAARLALGSRPIRASKVVNSLAQVALMKHQSFAEIKSEKLQNSLDNTAAVRSCVAALASNSLEKALELANELSKPTHIHADGLTGSFALTASIFWAQEGQSKDFIRDRLRKDFGYMLAFDLGALEGSELNKTAKSTVPIAIACALEAHSWEDAIQKVCLIGGDTSGLGAMAGALAEALYGIDQVFAKKAYDYLPLKDQEAITNLYRLQTRQAPWLKSTLKIQSNLRETLNKRKAKVSIFQSFFRPNHERKAN